MRIGVFGAGYVGLVTAVCLAEMGHKLQVVEIDESKVEKLNLGINTIYEPGLDELLVRNVKRGNLKFTSDSSSAIQYAEVIFLCVGTPPLPDGSADLSQVDSAINKIIEYTQDNEYKLVVIKSTVPVGTANRLNNIIKTAANERNFEIEIASNPEFLREGSAVNDFMNPDRIVIGASSERGSAILCKVYDDFDCPKVVTNLESAEIIKYASNSFLATKISFINMVADLCEEVGADVSVVARGMGYDKRIGPDFLRAGIGFGGSCFPKDILAFIDAAEYYDLDFSLLKEVITINNKRPQRLVSKLKGVIPDLKDKTISVLGLAFKSNTDDVRESPSAKVISLLMSEGATVKANDPLAIENFMATYKDLSSRVILNTDIIETLRESHAVIILTDWDDYKKIDWEDARKIMKEHIIIDARNMLDQSKPMNFHYIGMGKGRHNLSWSKNILAGMR
jgi:UDPglucose 6-dehydrogenase